CVGEYHQPNEENCGLREVIPGDPRTENPWVVSIYTRKNHKSPFQYFITGGLINPTSVFTIFGGGYGQPPYTNTIKKYHIPSSSNFLVVAGLPSMDMKDADEHAQFANIHRHFPTRHTYEVFHSLCELGLTGRFSNVLTYKKNLEPSYSSGFNIPLNTSGPYAPSLLLSQTSNDEVCLNTYKYYYRSPPDEIFCLQVLPEEGVSNNTCMAHGTIKVALSTPRFLSMLTYFSPIPRYYISGAISLIARKERGQCDINTIYHVVNIWGDLDWVKSNIICDPDMYSCSNGKCIPLHQVCDGKQDCSTAGFTEDEDPVFCSATNRCKTPNSYQCGLEGACISLDQVGDDVEDCPSGSDEDIKVVFSRKEAMPASPDGIDSCDPIMLGKGVLANCSHPQFENVDCLKAPPGTVVTLSCDKYYIPTSRVNFIKMKCYGDKSWKPFNTFSCRPECGLLRSEAEGQEVTSGMPFPWHAAILRENQNGSRDYICGASLVERNILITAGHCTTDEEGVPYDTKAIKISFNYDPYSEDSRKEDANLKELFEVEEIQLPTTYNVKTLESDIAVVKLAYPVTYSQTLMPICYLMNKFNPIPPVNSTGTVAGFGVTETGLPSSKLKYANLQVLPKEECNLRSADKFCAKSSQSGESLCHGDSGGGFVFPFKTEDVFVAYLLKGVVSNQEKLKGDQFDVDSSSVSGFTHLDSHSNWLFRVLQNITQSL
ncbi:unnamed protein product, partial [Allacma fusca]